MEHSLVGSHCTKWRAHNCATQLAAFTYWQIHNKHEQKQTYVSFLFVDPWGAAKPFLVPT